MLFNISFRYSWKDVYQLQPGHHLTINLKNQKFKN